ncbi:MAG: 2'-5' RNA ligase family protein [Bacteroidetes bacterium]|nr:2'-5' RNA ligase family protein [Bacteroidota bacterium]
MKKITAQKHAVFVSHAGYRQNEYMLILDPHEELKNKISKVKEEFAETFDAPSAKWGKPNLALVRFRQLEMMEERIINHLNVVAMGFHPVKVELKDFGSYPSHTIFIGVTTKEPIKDLVKQIRPWQKLLKLNEDHKPHFIDDPVFTVARQLKPWQYENAWKAYQHKNFTGRFIADSMLLLKREVGETAWKIARRFEFLNLPVTTKQGELFG